MTTWNDHVSKRDGIPRPPNVHLLRALWSLFVGIRGILKGSWGGWYVEGPSACKGTVLEVLLPQGLNVESRWDVNP